MKAEHSVADLEKITEEILEVVHMLQEVAATMRAEGMPLVHVHTKDVEHKHIPALWKWGTKLSSEFQVQLRVFQTARRDRSHLEKPAGRKTPAAKRSNRTRD